MEECCDPGQEAGPLSKETIELAQDLQPVIAAIRAYGHGEGKITVKVQRGCMPFIDWKVRVFRKK